MSFDLLLWPVDRAMSTEEAIEEIGGRASRWKVALRRDKRIDAFEKAMRARFRGLGTMRSEYPMEFDVHSDYVHIALPWSMVAELFRDIAPIAFEAGLAIFDPQRMEVGLPRPFADAPMGTDGVAAHEQFAASALGTITDTVEGYYGDDTSGAVNEALLAAGFRTMSPLGFEITPDLEAEVAADPMHVPRSLQTPERRDELIRALDGTDAWKRHEALTMLGGWDPDPVVRDALRGLLTSDDAMAVGFAANGLARQGSPEDLEVLAEAVHRMSPADGGTMESMSMPLMAAFDIAREVGPGAVEDLKAKAREWRQPASGSRTRGVSMSDAEFEQMLDALGAGPEAMDRLMRP